MKRPSLKEVLEKLKAGTITPEEAKHMLVDKEPVPVSPPSPTTEVSPYHSTSYQFDQEPIAIVGMSGRYPGSADLDAYWSLLEKGGNAISEIPDSRWDVNRYFDEEPGKPGKIYCKWLGMLDDVELFDPLFFQIPPAEAEYIDPQQRIFLQEAYRAFEDAGITPVKSRGMKCGVYVGFMSNEYSMLLSQHEEGAGYATANHFSIGAARISYYLDLKGPAIPVDTACSSSLVATHLACQALRTGEIDVALAGGVSLYLTADTYIGMCAAGMLSPDGQCHAFDQSANGFVPGEGVGTLVLKRLSDAQADGDLIHGLIVGSGINQDGRSNGMTAPSAASQAALEREIYQRFGIDPETIQYAEMHGTGTKLGDPVELEALTDAFRISTDKQQFCGIGSVKTNLGHTSAAAGVAGIHKVLLSFRHEKLVPSLHFSEPNEHFDFESSPFYVNTETKHWPQPEGAPRRACVSAFGFSGTNAHLVLEQYRSNASRRGISVGQTVATSADISRDPQLILLSARTESQLNEIINTYIAFLSENFPPLVPLAYTLQTGRTHLPARLAVMASSIEGLINSLKMVSERKALDGFWRTGNSERKTSGTAPVEIESALSARELNTLGRLWAEGKTIDWNSLYRDGTPSRLSLPTYRFARERYWFPDRASTHTERMTCTEIVNDRVTPLLRTEDKTHYKRRIDSDAPYLSDHRIDGKKVMPGVMFLDIARTAVLALANASDERQVVLSDVEWRRPLIVDEGADGIELDIVVSNSGSGVFWRIICTADDLECCRGSAELGSLKTEYVDIRALEDHFSGKKEIDGSVCYQRFLVAGIEYGPSHRRIEKLSVDETGVLARFNTLAKVAHSATPDNREFSSSYLPPGLLDAALQSVLGLLLREQTSSTLSMRLPQGIDRFEVYGTCADVRSAYIEPGTGNDSVSLTLINPDGMVRARFVGVHFAPKDIPSQTILLEARWELLIAQPHAVTAGVEEPHRHEIFLLGPLADHAVRLASQFSGASVTGWPLDADAPDMGFSGRVLDLIETIQKAMHETEGSVRIDVVVPGRPSYYGFSGLGGLTRTARLETPRIATVLIEVHQDVLELEPQALESAISNAVRNVRYQDGDTWQYRTDGLYRRFFRQLQLPDGDAPWKNGKLYWVSGGGGALGLLLAGEIIAHAPGARIILSSRSSLSSNARSTISAWNKSGHHVKYRQVDVIDARAVSELVEDVTTQYGPLAGIVHAAGKRHDGLLIGKQQNEVAQVLAPKVEGILNIDAATSEQPLEFMILFSSVAGFLGNVGQGDYASANSFLDGFAHSRNVKVDSGVRSGFTCSVAWPLWEAEGMRPDADTLHALSLEGLVAMPAQTGWRSLYALLAAEQETAAVLYGDRTHILVQPNKCAGEAHAAVSNEHSKALPDLSTPMLANLKGLFAEVFRLPLESVNEHAELADYGIDSVTVIRMTRKLEESFGPLPKTLLFEQRTLARLAEYLLDVHGKACDEFLGLQDTSEIMALDKMPPDELSIFDCAQEAEQENTLTDGSEKARNTTAPNVSPSTSGETEGKGMAIAIIGLAGRYPKARDLNTFWQNLTRGTDCISEIPAERWDHSLYYDSNPDSPGKTYAKWGGFLDGVDEFDPLFFNISPKEASMMDPQERLFLQCAYETLEDAGYARMTFGSERPHGAWRNVGVYVGVMYEEYQFYGVEHTLEGRPMALPGNSSSIANRVSYLLDLHGPSMSIDSMCSSSLVALHLACESLIAGQCRMAVAGGVNLSLHPNKFIALAQSRFASTTGRCKSFGAGGDGYVPAEGVGAVLLKPLRDAEADGDHIYGVIRGIGVNHGGKSNAYTVPNPDAQAAVIEAAYRRAGINPRMVSYLEAHGTGTSLGDPIEISGLNKAFREFTDARQFCAIGSVKSSIGHCESAAGISALTKVLLQMKHGKLVPSLHADEQNPYITFEDSPFTLQRTLTEWRRPSVLDGDGIATGEEGSRIAGISAFGAGGTNVHLIVEEYRSVTEPSIPRWADAPAIIPLSAREPGKLRDIAERLREAIDTKCFAPNEFYDLAYTLQTGRDYWEHRLALRANSLQGLREALNDFVTDRFNPKIHWLGQCRAGPGGLYTDSSHASLEAVASAWVSGCDVEWSAWRGGVSGLRVSAPTYPFTREHCWIPTVQKPAQTRMSTASTRATIHPLLHENCSTFGAFRFLSRFEHDEPFLRDHRVKDHPVLSGAAQLEIACSALMNLESKDDAGRSVGIRVSNIAWLRPLIVDSVTQVSISLVPLPDTAGSVKARWIVQSFVDGKEWLTCSEGEIEHDVIEDGEVTDIAELKASCKGTVLEAQEIYQAYAGIGVEYGPSHKGLRRVYVGEGQALAQLAVPDSLASDLAQYVLHPTLLDGAFQAAGAIAVGGASDEEGPLLPFSVNNLQVHAPCSGSMWAYVRAGNSHNETTIRAVDIDLYTDDGERCISIRGLCSRATSGTSRVNADSTRTMKKATAPEPAAIGDIALTPVWDIVEGAGMKVMQPDLVVSSSEAQCKHWLTHCPSVKTLTLDSLDSPGLGVLLENTNGIVWIAPSHSDTGGPENIGQPIDESPELNFAVLCFRWIKAILEAKAGTRQMDCLFITFGGVSNTANAQLEPAHATLHGLIGSLAKEYPHWRVRLVDCDPSEPMPVHELLHATPDRSGDAKAYRNGLWFASRLLPVALAAARQGSHRHGGVYVIIGGAGGIGIAYSEYLIRTYQAQVIWVGRRSCDAEIDASIARLSSLGQVPLYVSADAADPEALHGVFQQARERFGALHGVIHAALVLADQSFARMTLQAFKAALVPKIEVARSMESALRDAAELDFILFFSSLNSFTKQAGQGNYAAGCTFIDAFAHSLRKNVPYAVKVVNWGFWGTIGAVATEEYRGRMAEMGIGSIEAPAAMDILERLLAGPHDQLAMINMIRPMPADGDASYWLAELTATTKPSYSWIAPQIAEKPTDGSDDGEELDAILHSLLAARLQSLGWPKVGLLRASADQTLGVTPEHSLWLDASIAALVNNGIATEHDGIVTLYSVDAESAQRRWNSLRGCDGERDAHHAQVKLVEAMIGALPAILRGEQRATDVMFPGGSVEQVEDIYRGNVVSDYFNTVVATTLRSYLKYRLQGGAAQARLHILEIGAGSGGTSKQALECVDEFSPNVEEYCYTDVSAVFLAHGRKRFAAGRPYMSFHKLDVELDPRSQGIDYGKYDVVIAANVLHATCDMQSTIASVKRLLAPGGLLLLNEVSANSIFTHLTFGLLDGWWRFTDAFIRMPGGPALSSQQWQALLEVNGFRTVELPAKASHGYGQKVIAALSDGLVRLPVSVSQSDAIEEIDTLVNQSRHFDDLLDEKPLAGEVVAQAITWLKNVIGEALDIAPDKIDPNQTLERYGIDSITVVQLTGRLRETFADVTNTLLFEYNTIAALADHLYSTQPGALLAQMCGCDEAEDDGDTELEQPLKNPTQEMRHRSDASAPKRSPKDKIKVSVPACSGEPIAVIGMAGRYPKANTIGEFWENLRQGRDCISEFPEERGEWERYSFAKKGVPGTICTRYGGFIEDMDRFDPLFFQISIREAESMDPQERLFIEQVFCCIEDAGYMPATLSRKKRVGVYVGVMNSNYPGGPRYWSIANRASYLFDFKGPSIAVDSACSSSLTALHFACEALRTGSIDTALVGGVNLVVSPEHLQRLSAMSMLSSGSKVRAFGAGADGFVDGEGIGVLLLKPLSRAIADGDAIYGTLLGSAINAGGRTHGYTVPNPIAQAEVISDAYRQAGISPKMVSYIEAHGTGTALGDPIEIRGLVRAFEQDSTSDQYCALGSVKSNIGHTESAAGVAGVTKVLLQLRHKELVPSLHADSPNPDIDFSKTPFRLQRTTETWVSPRISDITLAEGSTSNTSTGDGMYWSRIASVSSFGAGGANAVAILSEHHQTETLEPIETLRGINPTIVLLSARDDRSLVAKALQLLKALRDQTLSDDALARIAYTLQVGRIPMEVRLAIVTDTLEGLESALLEVTSGQSTGEGIFRSSPRTEPQEAVVWLNADPEAGDAPNTSSGWSDMMDMAKRWVNGCNFNWNLLYRDGAPRRINLPAYPFAGERLGATAPKPNVSHQKQSDNDSFGSIPNVASDSDLPSLTELFGRYEKDLDAGELKTIAARVMGVEPKLIEMDAALSEYGFDGVSLELFSQELNVCLKSKTTGFPSISAADCAAAGSLNALYNLLSRNNIRNGKAVLHQEGEIEQRYFLNGINVSSSPNELLVTDVADAHSRPRHKVDGKMEIF